VEDKWIFSVYSIYIVHITESDAVKSMSLNIGTLCRSACEYQSTRLYACTLTNVTTNSYSSDQIASQSGLISLYMAKLVWCGCRENCLSTAAYCIRFFEKFLMFLKSSVRYAVITQQKTIFIAWFERLKPSQRYQNSPFKNYFFLIH
jgi:hypothetical protein